MCLLALDYLLTSAVTKVKLPNKETFSPRLVTLLNFLKIYSHAYGSLQAGFLF
jgi:hypothetical protein